VLHRIIDGIPHVRRIINGQPLWVDPMGRFFEPPVIPPRYLLVDFDEIEAPSTPPIKERR